MPQPHKGQVHVDRPLTNISTAYLQGETSFVAGRAFPVVSVAKQSDLYFKYSKDDFYRSAAQKRAPASESAGGGYAVTTGQYLCDVIAVHKDVDEQTRANSDDPLNADRDATVWVTQQLMLKREIDWVAKYFLSTPWSTTAQTGVASDTPGANEFEQWDRAGSTPVSDVRKRMAAILDATGYLPNTLVMPWSVFRVLTDHPDILDRIKYSSTPGSPAIASESVLAQVFGVERLLVSKSVQNTSVEGNATQTVTSILGKAALLLYAASSPSLMEPSAGYTFAWTGLLGAGSAGTRISRIPMDLKRADRIEGEMAYDLNVVGADLAQFFASAIG